MSDSRAIASFGLIVEHFPDKRGFKVFHKIDGDRDAIGVGIMIEMRRDPQFALMVLSAVSMFHDPTNDNKVLFRPPVD